MKKFLAVLLIPWDRMVTRMNMGMRSKLIVIFVLIKVIPLLLLAYVAWRQALLLGNELNLRMGELTVNANDALVHTGEIAVSDAINALNDRAREDIERMTTDTARRIADFLYQRDDDIIFAATLNRDSDTYRYFITRLCGKLIKQSKWKLAPDGKSWVADKPGEPEPKTGEPETIFSSNEENDAGFHYREPDTFEYESRPLFEEITFVDLEGNEQIKVTTSPRMNLVRKNISDRRNTYVKAERYWSELQKLKPGEIYVSEVVGAYVPSRVIGIYTPESAAEAGVEFTPSQSAYAGKENPLGKRFEGIIRWATPVVKSGRIIGYVTLALNHAHLMEFTSHIVPTAERYTEIPSAWEGNYAFIWDHKCRSIVHPRHHSITGYDPDTGDPQVPWLEESIYDAWQASGKSYADFIEDEPPFAGQSVSKKPADELTAQGFVGLDGRYLNFAPQCTGWFDLTKNGGSGSFLILWSGLKKLTTAAAIPYYTGQYGASRRGFGFVAIGAGLDYFYKPAEETREALNALLASSNQALSTTSRITGQAISSNIAHTLAQLSVAAAVMIVLVVLMAIWMASVFTNSITNLINGISRFRAGERHFRFNAQTKDELGTLADSFDEMADGLVGSVKDPLVITDMNRDILYANDGGLKFMKKTLPEILGLPYGEVSIYPPGSAYCPITALLHGREADVLYVPEKRLYMKPRASHLTDKRGYNAGYVIVSTDVTEIMQKQIELESAIYEANKANAAKGEFLARMSHEIRTPMNAIIGMTNIVKKKLNEKNIDAEDAQSCVRQIETSSQHLLGLLNDILDISKIDAGKIELTREPTDLSRLSDTVISIIKPRCDEKNIAFTAAFDVPPPARFLTDSLRLRQVLLNLLGNAVKFTPECGKIGLSISQKTQKAQKTHEEKDGGALVEFTVRDTGIGIPAEFIADLFNPFAQGGKQISRRYGGTGLGLSISRRIVQLMGGDISVESKGGEGSSFSFAVRMTESLDAEAGQPELAAAEDISGLFAGKTALLVDDVAINRVIAADLLTSTGMSVDEAEDGAEAVKMFEDSAANTYDIIYMDVQMPNMDGYEAASAIRAMSRPDAQTVPIVALTANAFKDDVDKALRHGMNSHLAKPVEIDKLLGVSAKFLLKK